MYIGAFDSTYKSSANATGNLYVCGNTGGAPTVYQVPITARRLGHGEPGAEPFDQHHTLLSRDPYPECQCPPGGATEWIFASAQTSGHVDGVRRWGGCVFNFKDTAVAAVTAYAVGQEILDTNFHIEVVETAGTSGATVPVWSMTPWAVPPDGTSDASDLARSRDHFPPSRLAVWVKAHHIQQWRGNP